MAGGDNHGSLERRDERCSSHATINPRRKREGRGSWIPLGHGRRAEILQTTNRGGGAPDDYVTLRGGAFIQLDRLFFVGFTERNGYEKLGVRLLESVRCGRCKRLNPQYRNLEASEWSSLS